MFDSVFLDGDSAIHRFDPRCKVLIAGLFSGVVALSSRWAALVPALCLSLLLLFFARLPIGKVCVRMALVNGLILVIWFFLPFSLKGTPVFRIGFLEASREGIVYAALLTIRANIVLLALISLLSTNSIFALARAMGQLGLPDKMVELFFFTFRYLNTIHLEYGRLVRAVKSRGFRPKTNVHTYRTYAFLLGLLLVRSYERAERVRKAMLCRGFTGRFYYLNRFSLRPSDLIMMALMLLVVTFIALLQWTRVIF